MSERFDVVRIARARLLIASGEAQRVREAARLTQSDVARMLGVNAASVSRWEAGERIPQAEAAVQYADLVDALRPIGAAWARLESRIGA